MKHNIMKNKKLHYSESLMDAFDTGIPCQSSLLDLINYSSNIIQNTETKIVVKSCKVIYNYIVFNCY